MIVVFIAAFFCVLNIFHWCVFFLKFKNLFSTDDIIASTHGQIEGMLSDLNRNAGRNIDLIDDRIRQLRLAVAEADRHLELAKKEIASQRTAMSYQQKIDSVLSSKKGGPAQSSFGGQSRAARQYLKNQDISLGLRSADRYELTEKGSMQLHESGGQGDLFSLAEDDSARKIVSDTGTTFTVESDGSSYASVPVIGGNVSYADEPVQPQQSFSEMARSLHETGCSIEEIARELKRSTTEVQMALDMGI